MAEISLSSARASIIDSVITQGLKSAKQLEREGRAYFGSVGSQDKSSPSYICFASIPRYEWIAAGALPSCLAGALYMLDESVLPVMMERKGENFLKWDTRLDEVEYTKYLKRLQSNFFVVVPMSWDLDFSGTIASSFFSTVIFTRPILEEYQSHKGTELRTGGQIEVVDHTVKKKLLHLTPEFDVPDYESVVDRIVVEQNRDLLIHGVRLPVEGEEHLFLAA